MDKGRKHTKHTSGEITALMKTRGAKLVATEDLGSNITEETLLYKCKKVNIREKNYPNLSFAYPTPGIVI